MYPVYHEGVLFGYKGAILTALDAETGDRIWRSRDPGDGLSLIIDGHLVIITKEGKLSIAPAGRDGYKETASLQVFDDIVWSPACFAQDWIYVRSMSEIACVEIVAATTEENVVESTRGIIPDTRFAAFIDGLSTSKTGQADVDAYLSTASSFPIIEGDSLVHFVYAGSGNDVTITGDHIGRRIEHPMHRVAGTNLFYYSSRLVPDARITYRFTVDLQNRMPGPRNPNTLRSNFFGNASWFGMPDWRQPKRLSPPAADRPKGKLAEVSFVDASSNTHQIKVYLPPNYDEGTGRYPVVYVHDARRPFRLGKLDSSLDYLVGKSVSPVILVVVPNFAGGGYNGLVGNKRSLYKEAFTKELIPFIDGKFRTIAEREGRANFGTGRGGFMAFYASTQHPDLFSGIAIYSTYWDQTSESERDIIVKPADTLPPYRVYLGWGRYDSRSPMEGNDTRKATATFARALEEKGYWFAGGMVNDGAGWASGRNGTHRVFETLFPARQ